MSVAVQPPGSSWWARLGTEMRALAAAGLDLVLPHTCPGCGSPGPWCVACASTLEGKPRAVIPPDGVLDHFAARAGPLPALYALSRYSGPSRGAIIAGKERGRRDLPPRLGLALGRGLAALQDVGVLPSELWLVAAPTRQSAARSRGGDPVLAMARAAAGLLAAAGRPTGVAPCLHLARRTRDSVGLDAAARARNLAGSIVFDPAGSPPAGAATVLLDDVFTTGATATASIDMLAAQGFLPVGVLVVATAAPLRPGMIHAPRAGG